MSLRATFLLGLLVLCLCGCKATLQAEKLATDWSIEPTHTPAVVP